MELFGLSFWSCNTNINMEWNSGNRGQKHLNLIFLCIWVLTYHSLNSAGTSFFVQFIHVIEHWLSDQSQRLACLGRGLKWNIYTKSKGLLIKFSNVSSAPMEEDYYIIDQRFSLEVCLGFQSFILKDYLKGPWKSLEECLQVLLVFFFMHTPKQQQQQQNHLKLLVSCLFPFCFLI